MVAVLTLSLAGCTEPLPEPSVEDVPPAPAPPLPEGPPVPLVLPAPLPELEPLPARAPTAEGVLAERPYDGSPLPSPPALTTTPRLDIMGTVEALDVDGPLARFVLASEVVNCHRNATRVELQARVSALLEPPPFDARAAAFIDHRAPVVLRDVAELSPGQAYYVVFRGNNSDGQPYLSDRTAFLLWSNATGIAVRMPDDGSTVIYLAAGPHAFAFQEARRPWRISDLKAGERYRLPFFADAGEMPQWHLGQVLRASPEHLVECMAVYAWDIVIDPLVASESFGPGVAQRLLNEDLLRGATTTLTARLSNRAETARDYVLENLRVVDDRARGMGYPTCQPGQKEVQLRTPPSASEKPAEPRPERVCAEGSLEERTAAAQVACEVSPARLEATVAALTSQDLGWRVTCADDAKCDNGFGWYGVPLHCDLSLIGDLRFTDELGNLHRDPVRLLKQFLRLGTPAHLEVRHEVGSERLRIVANYTSRGATVVPAQLEVRFSDLDGWLFGMQFDPGARLYELVIKPGRDGGALMLRPGAHSFRVGAEASGYQTLRVGPVSYVI